MSDTADVIIIGAGVHGASLAFHLGIDSDLAALERSGSAVACNDLLGKILLSDFVLQVN